MKYFLSLCLILFSACSSNEEKTKTKKYSDDTNRAFEMIERGGSYYLKKAPVQSVPVPQISAPQASSIPEKRRKVQPLISPVESVKKSSPKTDERLIEINQNLAFYCMKHRKDPRYGGDEARCMTFVNKTMSDCQKLHTNVNSKLLNCIQTKLKK